MHTSTNKSITLAILLLLPYLLFQIGEAHAQCTGCTQTVTINGTNTQNLGNVSGNSIICLVGTGTFSGNLDLRGNATLCIGSGVTFAAQNFNLDGNPNIVNYGDFKRQINWTNSNSTFENFGTFSGTLNLGGGTFINRNGSEFRPANANFNSGSFTNEQGGSVNLGTASFNGVNFTNQGSLEIAGSLTINGNANVNLGGTTTIGGAVMNNGNLVIGGNVSVGGAFTNNGGASITGSTSGNSCNAISIGGPLTNDGNIGASGADFILEAASIGGNRSIGPGAITNPTAPAQATWQVDPEVDGNSIVGTVASTAAVRFIVLRRVGAPVAASDLAQLNNFRDYTVGTQFGNSEVAAVSATPASTFTFSDPINGCGTYYYAVLSFSASGNCSVYNTNLSDAEAGNSRDVLAAVVYRWVGGSATLLAGGAFDITSPENWSPARNVLAPCDELVFDNGGLTLISGYKATSLNLARIRVTNNTNIRLVESDNDVNVGVFTLSANPALVVEAGSSLEAGYEVFRLTSENAGADVRIEGSIATQKWFGFSGDQFATISSANTPNIVLANTSEVIYNRSDWQLVSPRADYQRLTISKLTANQDFKILNGTVQARIVNIENGARLGGTGYGTNNDIGAAADFLVTEQFVITDGELNLSGFWGNAPRQTTITVAANLEVMANGRVTALSNFGTLNLLAGLNNDGQIALENAQIRFVGNAAQVLSGTSGIQLFDMQMNGADLAIQTPLRISGQLQFGQGIVDASTQAIRFLPTASHNLESENSYILGTALMDARTVGTSGIAFLGFTMAAGADDLGNLTLARRTGPSGIVSVITPNNRQFASIESTWDIEVDSQPISGRDVSFSWLTLFDNDHGRTEQIRIWRQSGTAPWALVGETSSTRANGIVQTGTVQTTTFSSWTATDNLTLLPIFLADFRAQATDQGIDVQWITEARGADAFMLERSSDGRRFTALTEVSGEVGRFNFVDRNPARGTNYYRLKALNTPTETYSRVVAAEWEVAAREMAWSVFPNPSEGSHVSLDLSSVEGTVHLRIFSTDGRQVMAQTLDASAMSRVIRLDFVNPLPRGMYTVLLSTPRGESYRKMLVGR